MYCFVNIAHDGSVKWWDMKKYRCIKEKKMHAPKGDEGVWSVEFHKGYKNIMASGGADSIAYIYV
jgi:striatin 1/3/4